MIIRCCAKDSFCVIGKEGGTNDGDGFIQRLWESANANYHEVMALAKTDSGGNPVGFWGVMSDFSRSFRPWEDNYTKGLYLAGVEADASAIAPNGWTKWTIPSYEYLYVENESGTSDTFKKMIEHINSSGQKLEGAVHDFIYPSSGKQYIYFPVRRLD